MEEKSNKKMNFFVRAYKSITSFDTYTQFAMEPLYKAIRYLAILILIFAIIITGFYIGSFSSKVSKGIAYLEKNIENISFTNSIFSYNNDEYSIYNEEENIAPIIIVDTSEEPNIEEHKDKVKLYNYGFILLRDSIMIFIPAEGEDEQFTTISYSDYGIGNMSKEEILNNLNHPTRYIILSVSIFILQFTEYFIYILLNAVTLAIIGQILAIILRLRVKFSETYKMGIYALTLPTLLQLIYIIINSTTGFVIQYFSWMYTTISYIYMCVAILIIKTDFMNMQRELMRITMEEQENHEEEPLEENKNTEDEDKGETEDKKDEKSSEDDDLKEQTDS